jgi:flavin-dependent dehydrogenase
VGFFGDGDLLDRALLRGEIGAWRRRLASTSATRERVDGHGYEPARPLRVLPAESSRLDQIAGEGWIALGDAAAGHDPLSSHGISAAMGAGLYAGHAAADLLAGRPEARLAYLDLMERNYRAYLELLAAHYARERRWPASPFWRRRRGHTSWGRSTFTPMGVSVERPLRQPSQSEGS